MKKESKKGSSLGSQGEKGSEAINTSVEIDSFDNNDFQDGTFQIAPAKCALQSGVTVQIVSSQVSGSGTQAESDQNLASQAYPPANPEITGSITSIFERPALK